MNILIAGSSGLIGTALKKNMNNRYKVYSLSRNPLENSDFYWNPKKDEFIWNHNIKLDVIINLCGEDISKKRWNKKFKKQIYDSRIKSTAILSKKISNLEYKPKLFISSSAIGYYGNTNGETVDEQSHPGDDFLAKLSVDWEKATLAAKDAKIRTIHLRTGIVLSANGGALEKMLPAYKLGLGVIFGRGNQLMNWISLEDVVSSIIFIIEKDNMHGAVNLVNPSQETNFNFSKTLGKLLNKKVFFKMPKWVAKLIFGEMADSLFFSNTRVSPNYLEKNGFKYKNLKLEDNLKDLL